MSFYPLLIVLLLMSAVGYWFGSKKALGAVRKSSSFITPRPHQFGLYVVIWALVPPVLLGALWVMLQMTPLQMEAGTTQQIDRIFFPVLILLAAGAGLYISILRINPDLRVRKTIEGLVYIVLILASIVSILTTLGIVLSLLFETIQFFKKVPMTEFFFGLNWSPQTALRADQVGSSGSFGSIPLFTGTLLITFIAMCVAVPLGLLSAVYMTEYASSKFRAVVMAVSQTSIPAASASIERGLYDGVCFQQVSRSRQAAARDSRGYPDSGIWLFCRVDSWCVLSRRWRCRWDRYRFGKRACRRFCDGNDDHSVCLLLER